MKNIKTTLVLWLCFAGCSHSNNHKLKDSANSFVGYWSNKSLMSESSLIISKNGTFSYFSDGYSCVSTSTFDEDGCLDPSSFIYSSSGTWKILNNYMKLTSLALDTSEKRQLLLHGIPAIQKSGDTYETANFDSTKFKLRGDTLYEISSGNGHTFTSEYYRGFPL